MKTLLLPTFFAAALSAASAQTSSPTPEPPPPMVIGAAPNARQPTTDNQRLYGPNSQDMLVSPDAVNAVITKFRATYGTTAAPRMIIYVNRELVETNADLKLTGHTENYEKTNDSMKTSGTNTYSGGASTSTPTLADKQTVRDIERLFGRVFRNAGAKLTDQKIAVDMLAEKPDQRLLGDSAIKQREALSNVADIVIEVLISSRNLTLPGISSDQSVAMPDIQATAIRLKDASIVGQASASDIIGKGGGAGQVLRTNGTPEITEATAIALMQDMLVGAN